MKALLLSSALLAFIFIVAQPSSANIKWFFSKISKGIGYILKAFQISSPKKKDASKISRL